MNNPFAMMGGMRGLLGLMGMMGGAGGGSGEIEKQSPDMVNITDGDMEDLQSEIEVKKERLDNINCPFKSCKEKLTFNNAKFHLALQ